MTSANFGAALKVARKAKGRTQESFEGVSSRAYLSLLERGQRSPTLSMIDGLAKELEVHPVTLVALAYAYKSDASIVKLLDQAKTEGLSLLASLNHPEGD